MDAGSRIVNFIRDGSLHITLKYTTLVRMRSSYAWTMTTEWVTFGLLQRIKSDEKLIVQKQITVTVLQQ